MSDIKEGVSVQEAGRRGGLQRAKNLTKEQRIQSAREAGKLSWANRKPNKSDKEDKPTS